MSSSIWEFQGKQWNSIKDEVKVKRNFRSPLSNITNTDRNIPRRKLIPKKQEECPPLIESCASMTCQQINVFDENGSAHLLDSKLNEIISILEDEKNEGHISRDLRGTLSTLATTAKSLSFACQKEVVEAFRLSSCGLNMDLSVLSKKQVCFDELLKVKLENSKLEMQLKKLQNKTSEEVKKYLHDKMYAAVSLVTCCIDALSDEESKSSDPRIDELRKCLRYLNFAELEDNVCVDDSSKLFELPKSKMEKDHQISQAIISPTVNTPSSVRFAVDEFHCELSLERMADRTDFSSVCSSSSSPTLTEASEFDMADVELGTEGTNITSEFDSIIVTKLHQESDGCIVDVKEDINKENAAASTSRVPQGLHLPIASAEIDVLEPPTSALSLRSVGVGDHDADVLETMQLQTRVAELEEEVNILRERLDAERRRAELETAVLKSEVVLAVAKEKLRFHIDRISH